MSFLDKTGLEHTWTHIVSKLDDKVDKTMIDSIQIDDGSID